MCLDAPSIALACVCVCVCRVCLCVLCCVEQQRVTSKRECARRSGGTASKTPHSLVVCIAGACYWNPHTCTRAPALDMQRALPSPGSRPCTTPPHAAHSNAHLGPFALAVGCFVHHVMRHVTISFLHCCLRCTKGWQGFSWLRLSLRTLHPLGSSGSARNALDLCVACLFATVRLTCAVTSVCCVLEGVLACCQGPPNSL